MFPGEPAAPRRRSSPRAWWRATASSPARAALAQARVGDTPPGAAADRARARDAGARRRRPRPDRRARDRPRRRPARLPLPLDGGRAAPQPARCDSALLPGALFRKHQKVEVEVRAFDGQLEGPAAARRAHRAQHAAHRAAGRDPAGAPAARRAAARGSSPRRRRTRTATPITYRLRVAEERRAVRRRGRGRARGPRRRGRARRPVRAHRHAERRRGVGPEGGRGDRRSATRRPLPPRIAIEPRAPEGRRAAEAGRARSRPATWTASASRSPSPGRAREADRHRRARRSPPTPVPQARAGARGRDAARRRGAGHARRRRGAWSTTRRPTAPVVAFATEQPDRHRAAARDREDPRDRPRRRRGPLPVPLAPRTACRARCPTAPPASRATPFWTTASEVPAKALAKGQRWAVEVRAHDGEHGPGPVARATATIVNSPPPAPRIAFAPARPRRVDGIAVTLEQPPDPGRRRPHLPLRVDARRPAASRRAPDQAQIPRGVAKKGQRWAVEVVASDGEAESPAARHEAVIADTAPGPDRDRALRRAGARRHRPARARSPPRRSDPDGDPVTYRHEWTVNGEAVPSASGPGAPRGARAAQARPRARRRDALGRRARGPAGGRRVRGREHARPPPRSPRSSPRSRPRRAASRSRCASRRPTRRRSRWPTATPGSRDGVPTLDTTAAPSRPR